MHSRKWWMEVGGGMQTWSFLNQSPLTCVTIFKLNLLEKKKTALTNSTLSSLQQQ